MTYTKEVKLKHDEVAAKINTRTGEVIEVKQRPNNLPEGKSKLDYKKYHITNDLFATRVKGIFSYEEIGIVTYMSSIAEINTNSLKPLTNETSAVILGEKFGIDRKKVKKIFDKLFNWGVYLQLTYYSYSEDAKVTYWVLNPFISWKGNLKDDSIYTHFKDTNLTKLLL